MTVWFFARHSARQQIGHLNLLDFHSSKPQINGFNGVPNILVNM